MEEKLLCCYIYFSLQYKYVLHFRFVEGGRAAVYVCLFVFVAVTVDGAPERRELCSAFQYEN